CALRIVKCWNKGWSPSSKHTLRRNGFAILKAAGIPSSLVLNFAEVVAHPQSVFREMFPWMEHARAGAHRVTGSPIKMSETPGRPATPAPVLGEHTAAVLNALLGKNDESIRELIAAGVIPPASPDKPVTPRESSFGKDQ